MASSNQPDKESIVPFTYKIAEFEWEFELIAKLNYETFVEEIEQHPKNHL